MPKAIPPLVWGVDGDLDDLRWFHADPLGSIIAASNINGTRTGPRYTYSPYGEPQGSDYDAAARFRYTGQLSLKDAPLWHYRARAYNPGLGRFMQTDPVGYEDQMNLYAYVGNDPVNAVDPSGMVQIDRMFNFTNRSEENYDDQHDQIVDHLTRGGLRGPGEPSVKESIFVNSAKQFSDASIDAAPDSVAFVLITALTEGLGSALSPGVGFASSQRGTAKFSYESVKQGPRFFRGAVREEALSLGQKANGSFECVYCGRSLTKTPNQPNSVQLDHVIPYSKGGRIVIKNSAMSCKSCNSSKGSRLLGSEWIPPRQRIKK